MINGAIVKLRTYLTEDSYEAGTGIILDEHHVLAAEHVVIDGCETALILYDEKIPAFVEKKNKVAAILRVEEASLNSGTGIFSCQEITDEQSEWLIQGFITVDQCEHEVKGRGISKTNIPDETWSHNLYNIYAGVAGDYRGLSGSPVFSCNRIIGILQQEYMNEDGKLGLQFSSVEMFRELLKEHNLTENEYYDKVRRYCCQYTKNKVENNIKNRKYIPDIFAEEEAYKEYMRCFADEPLFLKKCILDCQRLDFSVINRFIPPEDQITFMDVASDFPLQEIDSVILTMCDKLQAAVKILKDLARKIEETGEKLVFNRESVECYSIRIYLETELEKVCYMSRKYILLTKAAGQGKTNFVCDFTRNFLLRKQICTLYFNAYELQSDPVELILDKLCLESTYSREYICKVFRMKWIKYRKPVVIIIDGLNENTKTQDFDGIMNTFIEKCRNYPFIKAIMTTRSELLQERFSTLLQQSQYDDFEKLFMQGNDEMFKERIFWGYLKFFDIEIREDTLMGNTYDKLTDDILLLRFFCEVNHGARQLYMYDVYKYHVFDEYLRQKSEEYRKKKNVFGSQMLLDKLINHIASYMVEKFVFFQVPIDIFDSEELQILEILLENDVIFKSEQKIQKGVLHLSSEVISFAFDEFRDFCLTRYLLQYKSEEQEFMSFWNEMKNRQLTIREGIEKYVFYLAYTECRDTLLPMVKKLSEYPQVYWNYVWHVEDNYFTEEDISLWKSHLVSGGKYAKKIVKFLLDRYDVKYFKCGNIHLLMESMEEIMEDECRYLKFIRDMFGMHRKDRFGRMLESESVYPIDKFLKFLDEDVENAFFNEKYREWYRMTVYLLSMSSFLVEELWEKLYHISPDVAIELLQEINERKYPFLQSNTRDILNHLISEKRGDSYDQIVEELLAKNTFQQEFADISALLEGMSAGVWEK